MTESMLFPWRFQISPPWVDWGGCGWEWYLVKYFKTWLLQKKWKPEESMVFNSCLPYRTHEIGYKPTYNFGGPSWHVCFIFRDCLRKATITWHSSTSRSWRSVEKMQSVGSACKEHLSSITQVSPTRRFPIVIQNRPEHILTSLNIP